jgi:SAM-dependent methyltransferase
MADEIASYNWARWDALAHAGALFTRPFLDLTPVTARLRLDPRDWLGDITGAQVLCLAAGGGRQSACFAMLGAHVTVLDLSDAVLEGDLLVAERYGVAIRVEQGDMRDLSRFLPASFDIVWQPYSINFVPDVRVVFDGVASVLRPGGRYMVMTANPFAPGIGTADWTGEGYLLRHSYVDGDVLEYPDEPWVYPGGDPALPIPPVREYHHTLGMIVNSLAACGFSIEHLAEETHALAGTVPGSWHHLLAMVPPWLTFWTRYTAGTATHGAGSA